MRILILSAHTDDAEFGAGGSIVKFNEQGHELYSVVFSIAEHSLPPDMPRDTLKREYIEVMDALGQSEENYLINTYRVRRLHEHRQDILEQLVQIKRDYDPDLVVGTSLHDYHQDHNVLANEMVRAFKNSASIICYELPWNHVEFNTQLFIKLEEGHMDKKIELISKYKSQLRLERKYFEEGMIRGWARMRGSQVDANYAEAYEVIRWIS